jgi:putative nucleotidyltransferase with HDIG domain
VTSEDPSQPPPGWLARLAERSSAAGRSGALLAGALALLVAVVSAWLLTPGAFTQRVPGDEALGTRALGNYIALRAHDILDAEATNAQRAAAVAAERPVFDWDEGAAEEAATRIRGAFAAMREVLPEGRAPKATDTRRRDADARKALATHRGAFESRLGARVSDDDFAALADARFGETLEVQFVALASQGLGGKVVLDARRLATARDRGLVVRTIRRGVAQGEHLLLDPALVRDLDDARGDVERAASALPPSIPGAQRAALGRIAVAMARPTLVFDLPETALRQRDAADRVKPVVVHVRRGEKIVSEGEIIEKRHLLLFRGIREQTRVRDVVLVRLGAAGLVLLVVALLWAHARRSARGFQPARKDALLLAAAMLASAGLAAVGLCAGDALHDRFPRISPEALFFLAPFAACALVVRSVLAAEIGLLFAVASGSIVGLMAGSSLHVGLYAILTSVTASALARRTRTRAGLFGVGAAVGAVGALVIVASHLFSGRGVADVLAPAAAASLSGAVLVPVAAMAALPVLDRVFGYLTDLRLLALANLNHPALKDLIVQAPGTYHHSVIMGALVEAGADAIGADPLLARVCAYYHDLGKTRNPLYFGENQRSENRHEQLAASMSALIVKRHVVDGLELARHWGLPRQVADVITQHHGTRLVSFFWAKAQTRAGEAGSDPLALDEAVFRYSGPKPQTREAALVMIADACEASARSLPEPDVERLRELVHKRINEIFSEGQLDECELTLKDLNAIAAAMVTGLQAVYPQAPGSSAARPAPATPPTPVPQLQLVASERRLP